MTTISELISNAMRAGGGEASTLLWRSVLVTIQESAAYSAKEFDSECVNPSRNVLCRLGAMSLTKCLKRDYQWEVWPSDLGVAVSRLCLLIEEKELLLNQFQIIISHLTIVTVCFPDSKIITVMLIR